jgi:cell wall-associated NlpC family hydrolase
MMGLVLLTRDDLNAGLRVAGAPLSSRVAAAITESSLSLSTSQTSQLELTIADPNLELLSPTVNGLAKRTRVDWGPLAFEVAVRGTTAVGGNPGLSVTLRARGVQQLKRRTGARVWRSQSYTTWLRSEARAVGLAFYGQPSPTARQVLRGKDESSWAVAQRGARELGFIVYESAGAIYFGQPRWLVAHLPRLTVARTAAELHAFPELRDSDDDETAGVTGSLSIAASAAGLYLPGRGVHLTGLGPYTGVYQITGLSSDLDGGPASVQLATPIDPDPEPADTGTGRSTSRSKAASMTYRGTTVSGGPRSAEAFVSWALKQAGDRYIFGAEALLNDPDPSAWDCSELTQWAAHRVYLTLPDGAANQLAFCRQKRTTITIAKAKATRGALLFGNGHVAISLGGGQTIEAANHRLGVRKLSSANRPWIAGALLPGADY